MSETGLDSIAVHHPPISRNPLIPEGQQVLRFTGKQALPAERSEGSRTTPDKILRCAQDDIAALR